MTETLPVLPLRDIVVFPHMIVPLFVGREKSVKALEEVMRDDKHILVVTQKNAQDDDPTPEQIYATGVDGTGTVARALGVSSVLPMPVQRDALVGAVRRLVSRQP